MHVRILMGTYNGAAWLNAQLESLLQQTHDDWSLWVSDDGSTDETCALLAEFDRDHPGRLARLLTGPGRGSAANFLSLLCHPDLPSGVVALSDQDDVWNSEKLARGLACLPEHSTPAAYAARYVITDADLVPRKTSARWARGPGFGNALVQNVMSGHTTMLNAPALAVVRAVGPQDVPHHDWWLYQLLSGVGAAVFLDDAPVMQYRQHGENVVGTRMGIAAAWSRLRMINNRGYTHWLHANRRALRAASEVLTPQACQILEAFDQIAAQHAWGRIAALRRGGIRRQTRRETALLYLAVFFGRI